MVERNSGEFSRGQANNSCAAAAAAAPLLLTSERES